jgi:hypothetical protein
MRRIQHVVERAGAVDDPHAAGERHLRGVASLPAPARGVELEHTTVAHVLIDLGGALRDLP